MIIFAFGTLRPKLDIAPVLAAIKNRLTEDFGLNVEIGRLDDPSTLSGRQDLMLADASHDLQTLHISGLGKASRLFVFHSGPAKIASGLQQFLQSLSVVHGKTVRLVFNHQLDEENVYQIEAKLRQPTFGFMPGDGKNPPDVRDLAAALFQEYYTLRLDQVKQARIAHILTDLATEALSPQRPAITLPTEQGQPVSESGPPAQVPESPAQRFLESVLQSLKAPFHVKYLFFRYIALRASMGQALPDAVEELLPLVMQDNAFEVLSTQFRLEHDLETIVRPATR